MTLDEYIAGAKSELDDMREMWIKNNLLTPDEWPMDMGVDEWVEQELATRWP